MFTQRWKSNIGKKLDVRCLNVLYSIIMITFLV